MKRSQVHSSTQSKLKRIKKRFYMIFDVQWSQRLRPKKLNANVAVPPDPVRVPSQRSLGLSLSANDNGNNEVRGLSTNLLDLRMRKTSTRRPSDKGCLTRHRLNWYPLPKNEIGRIAQHIRKERRKERGK